MTRTFFIVAGLTYALLLLINLPQLGDPLIRADDYPAYFKEDAAYYEKTLAEGRWLNYWWMSYTDVWPVTVNFFVYLLGWAIFSASAGISAFGPDGRMSHVVLASALVALSPQAYLISAWFNTLIIGVWVLALFGLISVYLSNRNARLLLLAAGPVSMLAYTTYPLAMAALLFARHDNRRSLLDVVVLLGTLVVSILLGLLLIYTLNYYHHGVFGLEIAHWRNPTPADSLGQLWTNVRTFVPLFFERVVESAGFGYVGIGALNIFALVLGLIVLARHSALETLYLTVALFAVVGFLVANSVKEGVDMPMRALIGAWIVFALILARAVFSLAATERAKPALIGAVVLVALYAGQLHKNSKFFVKWQAETRALAAQLPDDVDEYVIFGSLWGLPGASEARIIDFFALPGRLTQLTGVHSVNCDDPRFVCPYEPPFDLSAADDTVLVRRVGDKAFLRMPIVREGAWDPFPDRQTLNLGETPPSPKS